jgi:integrase
MSPAGRRRLEANVYADRYGIETQVTVRGLTRTERWPTDTPRPLMRRWVKETRARLEHIAPESARGKLAGDLDLYLTRIKHLVSWREIRATLRAWLTVVTPDGTLGQMRRHAITRAHVELARSQWTAAGVAPKTINHRVNWLRHLYRTLDGEEAMTPCDRLKPLRVQKTIPHLVPAETILAVERTLRAREVAGVLRDAKTRGRFMVLVATGKRPAEVMRARPDDVDLDRRTWQVRNAKGGTGPGIYLNDDMLTAWRVFIAADAWGVFETSAYARTLRAAGWPQGVRPYQARHSVAIELGDRGIPLDGVAAHLGHTRQETTRIYQPVLNSVLQRASEALQGRLTWDPEASQPTVRRYRIK